MKIIISNSSNVPIYEQIKKEIIEAILSDELKPDEMLPSIRSLAQDIRISVMTIKKAYDELERDGYIVTRQGKGSYVVPKNEELLKEQKQREVEEYMEKIRNIVERYHFDKTEIYDLFQYIMKGEEE